MRPDESLVRLQLFFRPTDEPLANFNGERLREAVRGLYEQVYHIDVDDPIYQATFARMVNPRLVSAVEALQKG
jgi:hypothetical protein